MFNDLLEASSCRAPRQPLGSGPQAAARAEGSTGRACAGASTARVGPAVGAVVGTAGEGIAGLKAPICSRAVLATEAQQPPWCAARATRSKWSNHRYGCTFRAGQLVIPKAICPSDRLGEYHMSARFCNNCSSKSPAPQSSSVRNACSTMGTVLPWRGLAHWPNTWGKPPDEAIEPSKSPCRAGTNGSGGSSAALLRPRSRSACTLLVRPK